MNRSFVSRFFLLALTLAIPLAPLQAAQPPQALIPASNILPIGSLNMSPANITTIQESFAAAAPIPMPSSPAAKNAFLNQLPADFATSIVQSQIAPTAVSYLASYMKNPYILLAIGEGITVAYLLAGQQTLPQNLLPSLMGAFKEQLPFLGTAAAKGALTAVAEAGTLKMATSSYASYLKPLMIGAEVVGAVSAYYSPELTDTQKALAFAGVAASITPMISSMFTTAPQQTILQKIKHGAAARAQEQSRRKMANVAVALIAVGAAVTSIQAWQSGELSAETHMLAGVALSQVASLAQEWSVYEYGYRATKQVINIGAQAATIVYEPIKDRCHRLVNGMFNAFGWRSRPQ